MKKLFLLSSSILIAIIFTSCNSRSYRLRVLSTNKIMLLKQTGLEQLKIGDTVQLHYSDAFGSWSIDADSPDLTDTTYLASRKTSDTTTHYFIVDEKIAVIDEIN